MGRKEARVLYWVLAQEAADEGFCGRLHGISWPACSLPLGWVFFVYTLVALQCWLLAMQHL